MSRAMVDLTGDPRSRRVWELMGCPPCYLVGGYVRDRLLGRESLDLDFTVEATVEDSGRYARRLARALRTRPHLVGRPPRAVWRIETNAEKVELFPLETADRESDLLRRDFSCNAIAWMMPSGPFIDLCGGMDAIRRRLLVGIAPQNFERDPVRLVRGARLAAQLDGFDIEAETRLQIRRLAHRITKSPRERVGQELLRTLKGNRATFGLECLAELGLLEASAPRGSTFDLDWLADSKEVASLLARPFRHPLRAAASHNPDGARLGLLFRVWRIDDPRITSSYGWPRSLRKSASTVSRLVDSAIEIANTTVANRSELIFEAGEAFPNLIAVAAGVSLASDSNDSATWRRWWRLWNRARGRLVSPPQLIDATQVASLTGCGEGPELGQWIARLQRATVRGEIRSRSGARSFLLQNLRAKS